MARGAVRLLGVLLAGSAAVGALGACGTGPSAGADPGAPTAEPAPTAPTAPAAPEQAPVVLQPTELRDPAPRPVESWSLVSDTELEVRFWSGVPECYGARATTTEDAGSVTVAVVTGARADVPPDTACVSTAVEAALRVPLASPLGSREVRDATAPQVSLPRTPAHDATQQE